MNVDIDIVNIEHRTEKAILFNCEGNKQFWCPKAMIIDLHKDYVTVYGNFKFNYIYTENIEDDSDDLFEEIIEDKPKKKNIAKRLIEKVTNKNYDKDLAWLLDPNWKPKAIYYNGIKVK
ncbi:hypothetical protein [Sulfurimonas sp.]|uniref:hypothetical protein n=1 Tax=Sulfurimonas sp. TaxID=2022749 RepID=UPI003561F3C4